MGGGARGAGGGAVAPPVFAKFLQNLPFLPQILAFLCLQHPHVPVSPSTFKFAPPSMSLVQTTLDGTEETHCVVLQAISKLGANWSQFASSLFDDVFREDS